MPWVVLLLLLFACDTGEPQPRVPFKLGSSPPATTTGEPGQPAVEPLAAQFEGATDHPLVDQKSTPFVGSRSVLSIDLDQDQDRDALSLVLDSTRVIALAVSLREPDTFAAVTLVPGLGLEATCELVAAKLSALSATKALASVDARCGEPKKAVQRREWIVAVDRKPFVLERIEAMTPPEGDAPRLSFSFSQADSDGDGHDDVLADVTLQDTAGGTVTERIILLDRSPALTFDAQAFEGALGGRAERAKQLLKKAPGDALREAQAVIALWSELCRAADHPSLRLAGKPGLPCAPSRATASARATWVGAQANLGHLREAVDGYVALTVTEPSEGKAALAEAHKTMARLTPNVKATLTPGPQLAATGGDVAIDLPKARFISETLLWVGRDAPIIYDLTSQTETPAPASSARVLDPSGTLVVSGFERRCAGVAVRIERATPEAHMPAGLVNSALVLPQAFRPDCVDTPQSVQKDGAGLRVLGWAPQGLLLARGSEVRLVPLGMTGKPAGEPRALDSETPRPAPLPAGRATPDGSRYAWLTPFGVVVFTGQSGAAELFRPDGWDSIAAGASDVAISPSGQKLVVLSGGQCHLITKAP